MADTKAPVFPDEAARLAALDSFDVLDTPPEEAFERITRLTRRIFGVPIATVAFIDGQHGIAKLTMRRLGEVCGVKSDGAVPLRARSK